jgi:hypothetical protein
MTEKDLARLVRRMRKAQSAYFRERTTERLNVARDLERKVDRCVSHVLDDQRKLFTEDQ